jgi:hypothetical protein
MAKHNPYSNWAKTLRIAHACIVAEHARRQRLRGYPPNFGEGGPDWLKSWRILMAEVKDCGPLPLP